MDDQNTGGTGGTGGSGYGGTDSGFGGLGGSTGGAGSANTPDFGSDLDTFGSGTGAGSTGGVGGGLGTGGTGTGGLGAGEDFGTGGLGSSSGSSSFGSESGTGSTGASTGGAQNAQGRAADTLENAAHRLEDFANQQGAASGLKARAGAMASSVASTLESGAQYIRDSDVSQLQSNLERQVREHPLQTLLVGVAIGWVIGKILK